MSAAVLIRPKGLARVEAMLRRLNKAQSQEVLEGIGEIVVSQTVLRIESEGPGPNNEVWPALSDSYADWKKGVSSGGLLQLEGNLLGTIWKDATGDEVVVGSSLEYAALHQFGGDTGRGKVKARPYLGLGPEDEDEVEQVVNDWLMDVMGFGL